MLIEMWTDFTCPFCYIGKKNLDDAIKKLQIPVEIEYHSFQTYPTCPRNTDQSIYKVATDNGMSLKHAKEKAAYIEKSAASVGLEFHMDDVIMTNTFDAHRLAMYAKERGLGNEMTEHLLKAVFTESKNIGDFTVLAKLASEVGLNYDKVMTMLENRSMEDKVYVDIEDAIKLKIHGVPHFIVNKKYSISGAQPSEVIVKSLRKIMKKDRPFIDIVPENKMVCDEDGCNIWM